MATDTLHVFSLGSNHDVCSECGIHISDAKHEGRRTMFGCPGYTDSSEFRTKLIEAARVRGYEDCIVAIFPLLEDLRKRLGDANVLGSPARLVWELSRNLPRRYRVES
jgi:hypothetical protein